MKRLRRSRPSSLYCKLCLPGVVSQLTRHFKLWSDAVIRESGWPSDDLPGHENLSYTQGPGDMLGLVSAE
jgi:hypothetical protein